MEKLATKTKAGGEPLRPAKREPNVRERAAIDATRVRYACRPGRPALADQPGAIDSVRFEAPHNDLPGLMGVIMDAFGTTSADFAQRAMCDVINGVRRKDRPASEGANVGLAAVAAISARDEIEAQLGIQMAATHNVAMQAMSHLARSTDPRVIDSYGNLATKMLRTYTAQLEALAKLRRGGEQRVRVEHVHVHAGGQAIVGPVTTGGGEGAKNGRQPHAKALAHAPLGPVLRSHAGGDVVPGTGGEREGAVPDARRRAGERGPARGAQRRLPGRTAHAGGGGVSGGGADAAPG